MGKKKSPSRPRFIEAKMQHQLTLSKFSWEIKLFVLRCATSILSPDCSFGFTIFPRKMHVVKLKLRMEKKNSFIDLLLTSDKNIFTEVVR